MVPADGWHWRVASGNHGQRLPLGQHWLQASATRPLGIALSGPTTYSLRNSRPPARKTVDTLGRSGRTEPVASRRWQLPAREAPLVLILWSAVSSVWIYPHSLCYFNESIGGPLHGAEHLLGSNLDWGQDLRYGKWWREDADLRSAVFYMSAPGHFPLKAIGLDDALPWPPSADPATTAPEARASVYVLSVNQLRTDPRRAGYPSAGSSPEEVGSALWQDESRREALTYGVEVIRTGGTGVSPVEITARGCP